MTKERFARLLSVVLGPQMWSPLLLIALLYRSDLTGRQISIVLPYLVFFLIALPFAVVYVATKKGLISAWDMPLRRERYGFFIFFTILYFLVIFFSPVRQSIELWNMGITILLFMIVNTIITFFWKISLHMGCAMLTILLLNYVMNWQLWLLFLTLPFVFWSRLYLKRHTFAQLTAGGILPLLIFLYRHVA